MTSLDASTEASAGPVPAVAAPRALPLSAVAVMALALAIAPFIVSAKWLLVLDQIGIAVVAGLGLNLLVGYTGQISVGQGGFLAVGAYTSGFLITRLGAPTLLAIVGAMVVSVLIGVVVGLPALRLRGLYLAISTLAAQTIIIWTVQNWDWLTEGVGSFSVPPPEVFGFRFDTDFRWYWLIYSIAGLSLLMTHNLLRSSIGRAFIAIRDAEVAGTVMGVNPTRYKLLSFGLSSAYVGLAGALIGSWRGIVTWERFTIDVSIMFLAIIIVGGLGSLSGTLYGAAFITALPVLIDDFALTLRDQAPVLGDKLPSIQLLVFGLIIVVFLIKFPGGIAELSRRLRRHLRSDVRPVAPLVSDEQGETRKGRV